MTDRYNDFHLQKTAKSRPKRIKKRIPLELKSYNSEEINVLDVDDEFSRYALRSVKLSKKCDSRPKKQYQKQVPLLLHTHSERTNVHDDVSNEYNSRISLNSKIRYLNRTRDEENASELIFEEDFNNSSIMLVSYVIFE